MRSWSEHFTKRAAARRTHRWHDTLMTDEGPVEMDSVEAITKAGAAARVRGESLLDNPYYQSDGMSSATGETIAEWQRKLTSWELGWGTEDLMR